MRPAKTFDSPGTSFGVLLPGRLEQNTEGFGVPVPDKDLVGIDWFSRMVFFVFTKDTGGTLE